MALTTIGENHVRQNTQIGNVIYSKGLTKDKGALFVSGRKEV